MFYLDLVSGVSVFLGFLDFCASDVGFAWLLVVVFSGFLLVGLGPFRFRWIMLC